MLFHVHQSIFVELFKAFLNMDKLDSSNFNDKFTFRPSSNLSGDFGRRDLTCCVLVSHTGLVVVLAFTLGQDQVVIYLLIDVVAPMLILFDLSTCN